MHVSAVPQDSQPSPTTIPDVSYDRTMRSHDAMEAYDQIMNDFMKINGTASAIQQNPSMASYARPVHAGYNFDETAYMPNSMQVDESGEEDVDSCCVNSDSWSFHGYRKKSVDLPTSGFVTGANSVSTGSVMSSASGPASEGINSSFSSPEGSVAQKRDSEADWAFGNPETENPAKRHRAVVGFHHSFERQPQHNSIFMCDFR